MTDEQKKIAELEAKLMEMKSEAREVKASMENGTLTVTVDIPDTPTGVTGSGNDRYISQHYRYWTIPGTDYRVKIDVIRKAKKEK